MTKGASVYNEKDGLSNKWCQENWTATWKRIKLDHFLISYTKVNSKWIEHLNTRPEIINLLEEDTGSKFFDINLSNIYIYIFFGWVSSGKDNKSKNKWNYIKLKSLYTVKEAIIIIKNNNKPACLMGEDICK